MKSVRNYWKSLIILTLIGCNSYKIRPPVIETCILGPDACVCVRSLPTPNAETYLIETDPELIQEFETAKSKGRRTRKSLTYDLQYCKNYLATNTDDYSKGIKWVEKRILELKKCQRNLPDW